MHALSTPPAFILSQDQTLKKNQEMNLAISKALFTQCLPAVALALAGARIKLSKKERD
jgi:hypothetical protein